jgi:thiosulfate dehydrogenase
MAVAQPADARAGSHATQAGAGAARSADAGLPRVPFPNASKDAPPDGPVGEAIRLGERVLTQTQVHAKRYVGNGLNCTSCHLDGGKTPNASPWVGIWGVFPEYRSRNGSVNALQDRINDCFERSMNGKPLPTDSPEMRGVLAYMWWLSRGVPVGSEVEGRGFRRIALPEGARPDPANGRKVYVQKCASCHGPEGQGITGPKGEYQFPALWGPRSFNIGAGMARLNNAAAFVKANMPLGQGNTLSDQEAFDVAAYFTTQPRPDFARKSADWAKGGRPADARY